MLGALLPTPLHPAIVHLPIALTLLVPPFAIGALWAIRKGARPLRAWGIATALFAALTLSAWASVETGEQADEKVESTVAEAPIGAHEEAAELFLLLSAGTLGVAVVGLLGGRVGASARIAGTLGALALVVAGWRVGHSGGALVYEYGAANAYINAAAAAQTAQSITGGNARASAGASRREDDDR